MKTLDVIDRQMAKGCKVIRTRWVVPKEGTPEESNFRARWVAQECTWLDGLDSEHYASPAW